MDKMKTNQIIFGLSLISILMLTACSTLPPESEKYNYKPQEGYVSDEETAIAVAIAVWNPIYGKKQIEEQKPHHAELKDGIWTVYGSLPTPTTAGGTAIAEISKDDGRIIRITHEE